MKAHRNREPSDQVRVELDQGATLLVAAQHHLEGPPKFVDCLQRAPQQIQAEELHQAKDEVTRACPDQLRGTAARAGSEVFLLEQGHVQSPCLGVQGTPTPGCSATQDKQVELLPGLQQRDVLLARGPRRP